MIDRKNSLQLGLHPEIYYPNIFEYNFTQQKTVIRKEVFEWCEENLSDRATLLRDYTTSIKQGSVFRLLSDNDFDFALFKLWWL